MKSVEEFMVTVKSAPLELARGMLKVEESHGHTDRVDAINAYLDTTPKEECLSDESIFVHEEAKIASLYFKKSETCKDRGIDFNLSFAEYKKLLSRKACYYTGITLTTGNSSSPTNKTIDRVDNQLGYTKENCVTCSNLSNSIKNVVLENPSSSMLLTIDQFKRMASKL